MRSTIEKIKERKGITLIALAVTIVVILILAGITVGMVTSDNGILKETKNAKQQAEIDNEKSIVERAKMLAMMRSKHGAITYEIFEPAIKDEAGKISTDVSDAGDTIEVLFKESNRYYEIDQDGNVSEPQEVVKDEYAGDITKGGRCDGSEEKPYEINCIEDLVILSNIVNGNGIKFENGQLVNVNGTKSFKGEYLILTKNLNFKSKYSYADSTRTDFGNLNNDDTDGNSLMTEMTTGAGFTPISYSKGTFRGNFNGKGHTISNIYINAAEDDEKAKGLFGYAYDAYIGNLTITGKINSNWHTGGMIGEALGSTIENCQNKVDIIGYNMVGGIAGTSAKKIEKCKNYGTLEITGNDYGYGGVGGIIGVSSGEETEINNCINYGKITGLHNSGGILATARCDVTIRDCKNLGMISISGNNKVVGGIVAWKNNKTLEIINSENKGNIKGTRECGGIIGSASGASRDSILDTYIYNCYNTGKIQTDNIAGGIIGQQGTTAAQNHVYINNSYNLGKTVGKQIGNIIGVILTSTNTDTKTEFTNVYYSLEPAIGTGSPTSGEETLKTETEIKSQAFVDLLNSNIGTNTDWKKWKLGNDGYPTFTD